MKKMLLAGVAALMLTGCTTAEQTGVGGAAVGAAVGGLATGRVGGALAGAAVGGAAGYLIGRTADRPGWCRYRDQYGRTYEARCS
ncbi:glycine zipper domain-containing protein [Mesorhizobium sp. CAU 1732]|uniref:glycine zipper domain-containing protein n=1 Tax=Mesorhizobium sp. CAU 1732 TaxID=3140358 RepID=UPI003261848D